ncbi:MAG TPA: NAD(P)/FAD-dependent oxidoreductase [Sandaracinaceae bacterium LLY-WYZ-13_1]|nr:NAD(P)/FAD-dependent oxidoreductase [Sandaracinaceae bacterium LLY-WYZ-13_1]
MCVIGAGVSGLAAAKVLLEDGFGIDVFEKKSDLGGTWHPDNTYPGLRTNDPGDIYRFSEHPYPVTADEYPTAKQVHAYLHDYAERFDLRRHMQFDTEVRHVERTPEDADDSDARFRVSLQSADGPEVRDYDRVVVCNGVFSEPSVPRFEGDDGFEGQILHSSEVDADQLRGRRVIVVGGGKSAYDIAEAAAGLSSSCTLVFRSAHWIAPRHLLGVRGDWLVLTRFAQALLPYHTKTGLADLLHRYATPAVSLYWRFMSSFLRRYLDIPDDLEPDAPFPVGFQDIGAGTELYDEVRAGNIEPHRAEIDHFAGGRTIRLDTGATVEADLVVCATGFTRSVDFLDEDLQAHVLDDDGFFTLYRQILPPREPGLGFLGYGSSLGTTLTSEVGAHWLAAHFGGQMSLPEPEVMDSRIDAVKEWAARMLPRESGGHLIAVYVVDYLDELLRDMGVPVKRLDNWFVEHFGRVHAERYAGLGDERRAMASTCRVMH